MTDKWEMPVEGVIAAITEAGRLGYVINKEQMGQILSSAFIYLQTAPDKAPITDETVVMLNQGQALAYLNHNFNIVAKDFYQSGILGRLKWLFTGRT